MTYCKQQTHVKRTVGRLPEEKTPLLSHDVLTESESIFQRKETTALTLTKEGTRKPSLYRALIRTYCSQWLFVTCLRIVDNIFGLTQPFVLRYDILMPKLNIVKIFVVTVLSLKRQNIGQKGPLRIDIWN